MPWLVCKPFGDIHVHSICPQANTPILVVYDSGIAHTQPGMAANQPHVPPISPTYQHQGKIWPTILYM